MGALLVKLLAEGVEPSAAADFWPHTAVGIRQASFGQKPLSLLRWAFPLTGIEVRTRVYA